MAVVSSRMWILSACLCLASAVGCSGTPQPPPPPSGEEGIKELVSVYEYIEYSRFPPPRRLSDFEAHWDNMPNAFNRIQSGDYVVAWGVGRSTAPGAGKQVLAYEKRASTEGGAVLLRDGTVKVMTAEEFAKAPKAK